MTPHTGMSERAGGHPEPFLAGPGPHAFGTRLQHAADGLAVRGRLHVAAIGFAAWRALGDATAVPGPICLQG